MEPQPSPHPTSETLRADGLGTLDDASAQIVREHLEGCSDCRRRGAEIAPDSFLGRLRDAQESLETPSSHQTHGVGPLTESRVADDVTIDSSSGPCMSETGQVDATSAALNGPNAPPLQAGTLIGYFGDYELPKVLGEGAKAVSAWP